MDDLNKIEEFIYHSPEEIKCPYCGEMLTDYEEADLNKLEVSVNDFLDTDFTDEAEIECPNCHGRLAVTTEAEIAEIDVTYYVSGKQEPPDENFPPKDMPGQRFFWDDLLKKADDLEKTD